MIPSCYKDKFYLHWIAKSKQNYGYILNPIFKVDLKFVLKEFIKMSIFCGKQIHQHIHRRDERKRAFHFTDEETVTQKEK